MNERQNNCTIPDFTKVILNLPIYISHKMHRKSGKYIKGNSILGLQKTCKIIKFSILFHVPINPCEEIYMRIFNLMNL